MNRITLIKSLLDSGKFSTYLEIGCFKGKTFFSLKAKHKMAVDPQFHSSFYRRAFISRLKQGFNPNFKYFKQTSDDFFNTQKAHLQKHSPIDVAFVDGLHTYEMALRDVINVLPYLNKEGVIIMHDCFPPTEASALPTKHFPTAADVKDVPGWTGDWCGDVWKAVKYLKDNHSDVLDVSVINTDNGLGIARLKSADANPVITINKEAYAQIDTLDYVTMLQHQTEWLNLKDVGYAKTLIAELVG